MHRDEIIQEIWHNRDTYAREHHNNLQEIVADLRRRQLDHPERLTDRQALRTHDRAKRRR